MPNVDLFVPVLLELQAQIRDAVVAACERQSVESLSAVADDQPGDTIYAVDKVSEELLIDRLSEVAERSPLILIAEGIESTGLVLPRGSDPAAARWRVIVDPIDGTRGVMYQKRPAWVLAGVAPNRGEATRLRDIELAVMTEIPLIKQHLCDVVWAVRGTGAAGVRAQRFDRIRKQASDLTLRPSGATTIAHGCAGLARFFPGARDVLAAVDDQTVRTALGPPQPGKAQCFEDQYACTGGQLYELMTGHDRFVADVRPLMRKTLADRGLPMPLCCHPYDLCTMLIAEELGVVVTDEHGRPLDAPLDLDADVSWCGYANAAIQREVELALQSALRAHGLRES
jgi:fructose-1,6-bisphosphatase/inositol monophosphatase family enzyme